MDRRSRQDDQPSVIRVLTTYSKINYFVNLATQYGLVYDAFRQFEDDLNVKLKTKNLRVQVPSSLSRTTASSLRFWQAVATSWPRGPS